MSVVSIEQHATVTVIVVDDMSHSELLFQYFFNLDRPLILNIFLDDMSHSEFVPIFFNLDRPLILIFCFFNLLLI
jgi:hypothetical protein